MKETVSPAKLPKLPRLPFANFSFKTPLRYGRYILVGIAINGVMWGMSLSYLKVAKPVYTSKWALILPGTGVGVNVNLPEIGQASSSSSSPFGSASMDPRANYQFIVTDEAVLANAAVSLGLKRKELGKPKVKLVDNTSIMEFEVTGPSAEAARERSLAIYAALQVKLNQLRAEEISKRQQSNEETLEAARQKLQDAQKKLSDYKESSGLNSSDQIKELATNIEQLRKQKAESFAQKEQVSNRVQQLSTNLGLTPSEAADAFVLQADSQFQQNMKDYSEATTALDVLLVKWGDNHPLVLKERSRQEASREALLARVGELLGRPVALSYLGRLRIGTGREGLFRDLISYRAEQQGSIAQDRGLEDQIEELETRLQMLTQKQSTLDSLQRNVQITEAIFASTLAKLDLAKSDIFTAFPLVQIVSEPSLPENKTSPQPAFVFLGAGVGSLLMTLALVILWWRREIKSQISTRIAQVKGE